MRFHDVTEHCRGHVFWIVGTLGKLAGFPTYDLARNYASMNWGDKWSAVVSIREECDNG